MGSESVGLPKTLVDIVVVTFNSPELPATMAELGEDDRFRLLVIDNASHVPPAIPPTATLIRNEANLGFGRACNRALGRLEAPYVLFLNPDCAIHSSAVLGLLDQAEASDAGPGVIVGARAVGHPGQKVLPAGAEPSGRAFLVQYLGLGRRVLPRSGFNVYNRSTPAGPIDVGWVGGGCLLISRFLFENLAGFSDEYFMYGEDVDLCLRAQDAGARVVLAGQVTAFHPVGTGSPATLHLRMSWLRNVRHLVEQRRGVSARRRLDVALTLGATQVSIMKAVGYRPSAGRPDVKMLRRYVLASSRPGVGQSSSSGVVDLDG